MELQDQIKAVLRTEANKQKWRDNHTSKEFKAAEAVGKKVGSPLNRSKNCGCLEDLFIVLKILTRNKNNLKSLEMKQNSKFKLRQGKMIQVHGHDPLTNDNLTDESAIALLKSYPAMNSQFEVIPENWKELCEVKEEASTSEEDATASSETQDEESAEEANEEASEASEQTREEELLEAGKENPEVLRQLADALFDADKASKKAHPRAGVPKLVQYILDHE